MRRPLLVLPVLLAAQSAFAQPAAGPEDRFRPTRGLLLADTGISGDADATAVELNPGQLGFAREAPFALGAGAWRPSASLPGRGWGAFAALPFLGGSAFGVGVQQLLRTEDTTFAAPVDYPSRWKLSVGWGTRLGRRLGVGATWSHLYGDAYGGVDTWDAGVSLRLVNALALGFVAEDFTRPRLAAGGDRLPVRWVGEATIRPLATNAVEVVAGAYRAGELGVSDLSPRFRLRLRVLPGAWLFGAAEVARRTDPFNGGVLHDSRVTFGLTFDLRHASLALAGHDSELGGDGNGGGGFGVLARVFVPRSVTPVVTGTYVARLEAEGLSDERGFVPFATRLVSLSRDPAVRGVLLLLDDPPGGAARIEELRALVTLLRSRGKRVVIHLREASFGSLYLASAADNVLLHPAASVRFNGLGATLMFYEGALDKLGIEAQVVRFGAWKGAFEPYTRRASSDPVRQNLESILDDRFRRVVDAVAAGRPRTGGADRVRALVDRGLFTPTEAIEAGLVDGVASERDAEKIAAAVAGDAGLAVRDPDPSDARSPRWLRRKVVVVVIDGPLVDGRSRRVPLVDEGSVGGDTLVDELEGLAKRRDVGGVVLRVRSPGGSALASDRIGIAVQQLRAAGKPVVVSFGDVAASGGYYVAAYGDAIFAEPSTLTGSIGVIGLKVSAARLFDAIGVTTETIKRGAKADLTGPHREWTPEERDAVERSMRATYERFVATVADGRRNRGLTVEKVDAVGQGHVWTGEQARGIGLVDELGGVTDAIARAAALGRVPLEPDGMPDVEIVPKPTLGELLRGLTGTAAEALGARVEETPPVRLPGELQRAAATVLPFADGRTGPVLTAVPFGVLE